MSLSDVERKLERSIPGVGYSVERGEAIVQGNNYHFIG
jgi:hypothetical protein